MKIELIEKGLTGSEVTKVRIAKVKKVVEKLKREGYLSGYEESSTVVSPRRCNIVYIKKEGSIVKTVRVGVERGIGGGYVYSISEKKGVSRDYVLYYKGIESLEELEYRLESREVRRGV